MIRLPRSVFFVCRENSCAENSTEKTSKMDIDTMSEQIYNATVDRMSE